VLASADGWLNINRSTDLNFMHTHDPEKWSAVYFVHAGARESGPLPAATESDAGASGEASGEANEDSDGNEDSDSSDSSDSTVMAPPNPDGHLVFRGGRQDGVDASHSYLAVPPEAGTLWLFPGRLPHVVLGHLHADDPPRSERGRSDHSIAAHEAVLHGRIPEAARISVAINFEKASAPPPHRQAAAPSPPPPYEPGAAAPTPEWLGLSDAVAESVSLRNGRVVSVREPRHSCWEDSSWEGGSVWPPAALLVAMLNEGLHLPPEALAAATVLECGAGCGLVGLAAALLGARSVTLTDLPIGLPTLAANASENALPAGEGPLPVEVASLDWRAPEPALLADGRTFDYVIASECLYHEDMVLPLLRTAHRACAPDGTFFLAGVIGSAPMHIFQRHVSRFFASCDLITPRAGEEPPPAPRAIHRISRRREHVRAAPTDTVSHLLGGDTWPAAYVLADFLLSEPWLHTLRGAHVLELGAGSTGHAGLVAALTGLPASVTLSDKHEALVQLLDEAILDNHLTATATAAVYEWGEPSPLHERAFDLVLAADCIYSHGTAGAFCDALDVLVRSATRVLMCCEERWSLAECTEVLQERGWSLKLAAEPVRPSDRVQALISEHVREMGEGVCYIYEACRVTKHELPATDRAVSVSTAVEEAGLPDASQPAN